MWPMIVGVYRTAHLARPLVPVGARKQYGVKNPLVELVMKSTRPLGVVAPEVAVDMIVAVQVEAVFTLVGELQARVVTVG